MKYEEDVVILERIESYVMKKIKDKKKIDFTEIEKYIDGVKLKFKEYNKTANE